VDLDPELEVSDPEFDVLDAELYLLISHPGLNVGFDSHSARI
jgi:hypothetical protein